MGSGIGLGGRPVGGSWGQGRRPVSPGLFRVGLIGWIPMTDQRAPEPRPQPPPPPRSTPPDPSPRRERGIATQEDRPPHEDAREDEQEHAPPQRTQRTSMKLGGMSTRQKVMLFGGAALIWMIIAAIMNSGGS